MRKVMRRTRMVRHRRKHPARHERTVCVPDPVLCTPTGSCLGPMQQGGTLGAVVGSTKRNVKRFDSNTYELVRKLGVADTNGHLQSVDNKDTSPVPAASACLSKCARCPCGGTWWWLICSTTTNRPRQSTGRTCAPKAAQHHAHWMSSCVAYSPVSGHLLVVNTNNKRMQVLSAGGVLVRCNGVTTPPYSTPLNTDLLR